jgi:hypothetical protein
MPPMAFLDPAAFEDLSWNWQVIHDHREAWELSKHSANSALQSLTRRDPARFKSVPKTAFLNSVKSMLQSRESGRFKKVWVVRQQLHGLSASARAETALSKIAPAFA